MSTVADVSFRNPMIWVIWAYLLMETTGNWPIGYTGSPSFGLILRHVRSASPLASTKCSNLIAA